MKSEDVRGGTFTLDHRIDLAVLARRALQHVHTAKH